MRSDAERTEVLPTERERQADGVSRHRTNNARLCEAVPDTAFPSDRGCAERVKQSGGGLQRN